MSTIKVLVTNQKGGVGKSTVAANLAAYLCIQNQGPVSLIDFDKQSSSAKWAQKAPDIGLQIHNPSISYDQSGSLVLSETKRYLNLHSKNTQISISDLTWTYTMSPEFMLEFDFVLIPSSTSKFEMASSEIFILKYIEKYLSQIQSRGQQILLVPSRVDNSFNPEQKFLNLVTINGCSISPPIHFIPAIDQFIYEDFLCVSTNSEIANNFIKFGQYVAELINQKIKHKKNQLIETSVFMHQNNLTILEKFKIEQKSKSPQNTKKVSDWVPQFLFKKSSSIRN
jgi:cellulose biosynthesis protein BcsQ